MKRFYTDLVPVKVDATTVAQALALIDTTYPGLKDYIVDEQGRLRKHVNIFIGNTLIKDRTTLQDALSPSDTVFIMQALSGG
ncbi:MoaD/ThiS family protein [Rapidithrix thailandica]|uniref:MoaD/ThiS family protein n=1 Tax=Rapidithrix thailandica TaxID=413964 RepID=A0AAW9S521_9BACT